MGYSLAPLLIAAGSCCYSINPNLRGSCRVVGGGYVG